MLTGIHCKAKDDNVITALQLFINYIALVFMLQAPHTFDRNLAGMKHLSFVCLKALSQITVPLCSESSDLNVLHNNSLFLFA